MKPTTIGLSFLVCVLLATVAAGCGGDDPGRTTPSGTSTTQLAATAPQATPPSVTGNGIAPCSLITRGEAESALGSPGLEPEAKGAVCHYDTEKKTKFFDLTARTGTGNDFENMRNLCGSDTQPVAGLGDSSCSANNTAVVLRKDVLIYIIAGGVFNQDDLTSLAGIALTRLQ
jgi:Protein of unknown function (DUF3558)